MARRCKAFGMRIAYASEHPMKEPARSELEAVGLPIDELVATSDVISLHCPLTSDPSHSRCPAVGGHEAGLVHHQYRPRGLYR